MDFLPDIEKFKNFFDGTDSKNEISIAVEEAKKYDIFNLISRVSALNLFHQNQTKSVILPQNFCIQLNHRNYQEQKTQ